MLSEIYLGIFASKISIYLKLEIIPSFTISKKLLQIIVLVRVSFILVKFPEEKNSTDVLSMINFANV
jgi:hypothetical protein